MPGQRFEWLERIKAVQREHSATRFALDYLKATVERDPSALPPESAIRVRHIRDAAERLDGTYIIRLFAEFESGLRTYWLATIGEQIQFIVEALAARHWRYRE